MEQEDSNDWPDSMSSAKGLWPHLAWPAWRETALTLQLWTQIVGKVRLQLAPWLNHSWQVALYVTARGLGTSGMPVGDEILDIEFDFIEHRLLLRSSTGEQRTLALVSQSVAAFYARFTSLLRELQIAVSIHELPNEVLNPIPFSQDESHHTYDAEAAHAFWRVLVQADRLLKEFRTGFLGKASPVHFFWGSFDLAVTRFSGRAAPPHPGGVPGLPDAIAREAYSHEVSSAGFWPGSDAYPSAAFYSYAYPEPAGFRARAVTPGASFETKLGEFILPYELVRASINPDELVLDFLSSTYAAAADAGGWDRARLECPLGVAGRVRPLSGH
jgi:Family of unknown function (DUF5996)